MKLCAQQPAAGFDWIIASDVLYDPCYYAELWRTVELLATLGSRFVLCCTHRHALELSSFLQAAPSPIASFHHRDSWLTSIASFHHRDSWLTGAPPPHPVRVWLWKSFAVEKGEVGSAQWTGQLDWEVCPFVEATGRELACCSAPGDGGEAANEGVSVVSQICVFIAAEWSGGGFNEH